MFDKYYLKLTLITFLTVLLTVGIIIYIAYHIAGSFGASLELSDAVYESVTRVLNADGYVMRHETVLYASHAQTGSVTPAVQDGTRLGIYDKAADIYDNTMPDVQARIREIDEQIALLEDSQSEKVSVVNTSGLESAIFNNVQDIRLMVENRSYGDATTMRSTLLVNILKRDILKGTMTDHNDQLTALKEEKRMLTNQLGACLETVYAPVSGYFYADTDGYESLFSADGIDTMSYESFMELTRNDPGESMRSTVSVGKIVTDYRWYLSCPVSKKEAAELVDGQTYAVTFPYNGNKVINMKLYSVIPALPGDGAILVFVTGTIPENFDYTRMQPVQIGTVEYSGFRVPVSAVRVIDGYEGVYILDQVTVQFRRIHIVYEGDGYYICTGGEPEEDAKYSWIQMNDVIITEGINLYVGKVITGKDM
ncbi:MAG: hypothetical protein IJ325_06970 [Clostridia bacterium]|nr:hypothetical protein [Clostridia bacterium]